MDSTAALRVLVALLLAKVALDLAHSTVAPVIDLVPTHLIHNHMHITLTLLAPMVQHHLMPDPKRPTRRATLTTQTLQGASENLR